MGAHESKTLDKKQSTSMDWEPQRCPFQITGPRGLLLLLCYLNHIVFFIILLHRYESYCQWFLVFVVAHLRKLEKCFPLISLSLLHGILALQNFVLMFVGLWRAAMISKTVNSKANFHPPPLRMYSLYIPIHSLYSPTHFRTSSVWDLVSSTQHCIFIHFVVCL